MESNESPAIQGLRRLSRREFDGWRGLSPGTRLADVARVFAFEGEEAAPGVLGTGRQAGWLAVEAEGFDRGLRVWLDSDRVLVIEGEAPSLSGSVKDLLATLGPPQARLDSYVGTYEMADSELVYADRGITLYVNPRNLTFLRLAVYEPASLVEYEEGLRLNLQTVRLPLHHDPPGGVR